MIPNLSGLARTYEVFRATGLAIADKNLLNDKKFQLIRLLRKIGGNDLYDLGPVGSNLILHSFEILKEVVAEDLVLSIGSYEKVDDFALGIKFVKVAIKKTIKSDNLLSQPCTGVNTVGEAVGCEFVNVMEK